MSIGSINNDPRVTALGATAYTSQSAALGSTSQMSFKDAFKDAEESDIYSPGFGAQGESGGAVQSIAAIQKRENVLGQLQFDLLKSNTGSSTLNSRLNNALF